MTEKLNIEAKLAPLRDIKKLARESKRTSVYWNAAATDLKIVDLSLSLTQENLASFLSGTKEGINLKGEQGNQLKSLHYRQQNAFFSEKVHVLAIGLGLLVYKSPTSGLTLFKAPIFLKEVRLNYGLGEWQLEDLEESWEINPFVLDYLKEEQGLESSAIEEVLTVLKSTDSLDASSFQELLANQYEAFVPSDLNTAASAGLHYFQNAILSVFDKNIPAQKTWIQFSKKTAEPSEYRLKHQIGLLPANPDSASLLEGIKNQKVQYLKGGRSQDKLITAVNLLSNALSNGKRCLVISKYTLPLFQVQQKLLKLGLGGYSFLIKDSKKDFQPLVAMMQQRHQLNKKDVSFYQEGFEHDLNKFQRLDERLGQHYRLKSQLILGEESFSSIVGKYVAANKICGRELLNAQLNAKAFEFHESEYQSMKNNVAISEGLFEGVGTLRHPLRKLHQSVFEFENRKDALGQVQFLITTFKERGEALLHSFITKQASYNESLKRNYYAHFDSTQILIKKIKDFVFEQKGRFGEDFEKAGSTRLSLYGTFSKKFKAIGIARLELASLYKTLLHTYKNRPHFEFQFSYSSDASVTNLVATVQEFEQKLLDWKNRIPSIVDVERSRLNLQTVNEHLDFQDQISALEFGHELFIEELNQANLFEDWKKSSQNTLPTRQQHLEDVIEMLETTELGLRDFDGFYPWQEFWLQMPETSKKLVKALVKVKPKNWTAAFESWYFHHCLSAKMLDKEGLSPVKSQEYLAALMQVKSKMVKQIDGLWQAQQISAFKEYSTNGDLVDCCFGNNKKDWGVQQLLEDGLVLLSSFIPVLFLSEKEARKLQTTEALEAFDFVLGLEANSLGPVFKESLSALGKRSILIEQGSFDKSQSKIERLSKSILTNQDPTIFKLKNDFYFGGELKRMPYQHLREGGIFPKRCHGQFDAFHQSNTVEIEAILSHLNKVDTDDSGRYPMIGIACASLSQAEELHQRVLKEKEAGNSQIKGLLREGFGIWSKGESPSRRYDEVILSLCTDEYPVDSYDTFIFNCLESTRRSLHVLHSFEPETGDRILDSLLSKTIKRNRESNSRGLEVACPAFSKEVYQNLVSYFEKGRVTLESPVAEMINAVIAIEPLYEGQALTLVLTEGVTYSAKMPVLEWEDQVLRNLKQKGYNVLIASAEKWWKNAHQEARKLAGELIRMDNEYQPVAERNGEL